jgi:hypothetical protein
MGIFPWRWHACFWVSCHYSAASNSEDSTQFNSKLISRQAGVPKLDPPLYTRLLFCTQSQSQSHIATDDQSISRSCCRAPSGARDHIFITHWQLRSCFCEVPSLTRGRVWLLYMLLALASLVFFGFESPGTRDHILLSQISDFSFRRLLRLAGSRWRYLIPPPHGLTHLQTVSFYNPSARTAQKTQPLLLRKRV